MVEAVASRDLTFPEDPAQRAAEFALHAPVLAWTAGAFLVAQLAFLVALVLLFPALPQGRGAGVAQVGFWLFLVGLFGHAVAGGAQLLHAHFAGTEDRATATALAAATESSALLFPFLAAGLLGFALGFILLGVGLCRAGEIPLAVAVLVWVSIPVEFLLSGALPAVGFAARLVFLAALAGMGLAFVRGARPAAPA